MASPDASKKQRTQEDADAIAPHYPTAAALPIPERSSIVPGARQVEESEGIRLLDQSLQDLFVTGRGAPVLCKQGSLHRAHAWLTEEPEVGEEDRVTGSHWPLAFLVTDDGSQPHFVEPSVLETEAVRQRERPPKHPREAED